MRQLFNHHHAYNRGQHMFSILTESGKDWKDEKIKPTMHLGLGVICVEISRKHAARALIEARKNGYEIKSSFVK